jgi:hypothetical protein
VARRHHRFCLRNTLAVAVVALSHSADRNNLDDRLVRLWCTVVAVVGIGYCCSMADDSDVPHIVELPTPCHSMVSGLGGDDGERWYMSRRKRG